MPQTKKIIPLARLHILPEHDRQAWLTPEGRLTIVNWLQGIITMLNSKTCASNYSWHQPDRTHVLSTHK